MIGTFAYYDRIKLDLRYVGTVPPSLSSKFSVPDP